MTGLLYFIVVLMWASVLIPIGLKNHDRRNLEKSLSLDSDEFETPRWHWRSRDELTARQRSFIRRRRVAMILFSGLIATVILATAGNISFAWIALPTSLIFAFGVAAKKSTTLASPRPVVRPIAPEVQPEKVKSVAKTTVAKTIKENVEIQKRTWVPIEIPLPSYVTAERATAYSRKLEANRPWTGQEMIDAAVKLRQQREQKLIEAQARLEEARALALENARRAAIATNQNNGVPITPFRRAVNQ